MLDSIPTPRLVLMPFAPEALRLLIEGDRARAQRALGGLELPEEFPTADELAEFLPIQLGRMESKPGRREWMARLMIENQDRIVGHCGFHGPPDVIGRAEIGYTVFTKYRNRGFATEAAGALIRWAFEQGEQEVFASVSPDNAPSLAVVRRLGFIQVGTQDDEVDGLELVFAIRASQAGAGAAC